MYYYSGGGGKYDGGLWTIEETPKSFTFKFAGTPFDFSYIRGGVPEKCVIKKEGRSRHCLKDWENGTYTVYPFQNGTPNVFELINNNQ